MAQFGVHNEGTLGYQLQKLDDGLVVPDASLSEIHDHNQASIENQVEIGVAADELGYEFVVHPENHFKLLAKNSPNPLGVQTAIAARTDDVRLLQMANILPWHEPLKLAERIGTLDVLSDGRAEVGVGTGSGPREKRTFTAYRRDEPLDDDENEADFAEKCGILVKAWATDHFSHHGTFHDVPPEDTPAERLDHEYLADDVSGISPDEMLDADASTVESISVFPQPKQDPHPQLWRPIGSKHAAVWAAQHGINGCTFCTDFDWVEEVVETYYETAEDAGWPDRRPEYDGDPFAYGWDEQKRRGIASQILIFDTDVASDGALERYKRGLECLNSIRDADATIDADEYVAERDAPIVGSSDEIIDRLAEYEDQCGYDDLVVFLSVGVPGLTHEDKLDQIRGFSERIAPYFEE